MDICNIAFGPLELEIKHSKKENDMVHLNGVVDVSTTHLFLKTMDSLLYYSILEAIETFIYPQLIPNY